MENEYSKRHEIFQRFLAENFECVKGYLIRGIFDHRDYFWQEFQDFLNSTNPKRMPLRSIGLAYKSFKEDGKIKVKVGGKLKYRIPGNVYFDGDEFRDDRLTITVLDSDGHTKYMRLEHEELPYKGMNGIEYEVYRYKIPGIEGKGFVIGGPLIEDGEGQTRELYCSDIFTQIEGYRNPVSDASVFDAFFGFFSSVLYASKQEKTEAAFFNLEQTLRLIAGQPVNPLRYLVAFADQYLKYLFEFFGLETQVYQSSESLEGRINLDGRINFLRNRCKDLSLIQLLYLRKSLRNEASHEDKHIVKYRENVRHFILDFICITYLIQHKVNGGCNPVWNDSDRLEAIKTFFTHVATHNIKIDVVNDGFSENGACFIKPLKNYMASLLESSGKTVSNEIKIGKDLLESTNLELTLANGKITIDSNTRLEEINSFDYGPLVDSLVSSDRELAKAIDRLNGKVDSLPSVRDIEKFKKSLDVKIVQLSKKEDVSNEVIHALQEIKKSMDKDMPQLKTYIDEINKRIENRTWIAIYSVVALLIGLIVVALSNIEGIAIRNEFFYTLSQSIGIRPLTYNFPYERALYLENQIRENQEKDLQSGNRAKHELINLQIVRKNNILRAKAAECYQNAIEIYKMKVDENPDKNADIAARLARMYSLGKGGKISFDQALKYAQIAANADMEKYTGMYIYFQLSQGSLSEIKKTFANRLDYLSETDPFYPLIKAETDIADALSLPHAQKDSVLQQAIARVDSVATSLSPVAPFAVEQLAVWNLDGYKDASDKYIIDKNPFIGINYLLECALKFNLINSQNILANILCKFTFWTVSSELYAAAFYNGDINSGELAHDIAARLLRKNEEEIKEQWPRLYSVKKSRNNIEKIRQVERNLSDENYEYALINLDGLKDDLSDNLVLIGLEDAIRKCKAHIPDSVTAIKEEIKALPIKGSLMFRHNPDSLIKREALEDYVDAYFVSLQDADGSQNLIDSLLNESWTKGFVDAGVLLADRIYNKDQYHSRADEAFKIMKEASSYSDEANLWLADKYYITEISESRKYLGRVKNDNNFYKLIRQYDELELDHYNNAHPYTEKELSLMRDILNSLDIIHTGLLVQDLATYLIYCAAISGNQSAISFYLSSAHGINRSSCAIFYPIYIQECLNSNDSTKLKEMYSDFVKDFGFPVPVDLSPVNINYIQLRIRETSRGNEFYKDLNPYPSFLSRDLHPEPIEFKTPMALYDELI